MVPQPGLQVGFAGKGTLLFVSCVINQVTPSLFKSLLSVALKGCCSPVGTVAVEGVMPIAIPETTAKVPLPVLLVSACAVAVSFITRLQAWVVVEVQFVPGSLVRSGSLPGAVNVTVRFVEFAGMLRVSAVQGWSVVVLLSPVESIVVPVYVQAHALIGVSVEPLTVAVAVMDCETITAAATLTLTLTTLEFPPPPQPLSA